GRSRFLLPVRRISGMAAQPWREESFRKIFGAGVRQRGACARIRGRSRATGGWNERRRAYQRDRIFPDVPLSRRGGGRLGDGVEGFSPRGQGIRRTDCAEGSAYLRPALRSEEHTSELQSLA